MGWLVSLYLISIQCSINFLIGGSLLMLYQIGRFIE